MQAGEQLINQTVQPNWLTKVARSTVLKLLGHLAHGGLVIKEEGRLVERFGDGAHPLQAEINVLSPVFYTRVLTGGSVAAGETYTDGIWQSPDLTAVVRLFAANMMLLDKIERRMSWLRLPTDWLHKLATANSVSRSKVNIAAHYDLGNNLYRHFLDHSMMYSAAIYPTAQSTLAEAQQHKLQTICEKLNLKADDHLLEIGTGWGGLAIFAAKHFGCKVTTTTISEEQYSYTAALIKQQGLSDKITLLKQDYRKLSGKFDKLVSIEMVEAVGKAYLTTFFRQCSKLLKADGLMLLQSITISEARLASYAKGQDFIQRYIFPGGFLPSVSLLSDEIRQATDMEIRDCQDIGLHYAKTLQHWHQALHQNRQLLATYGYDERFIRLWSFYFCYCEGGFLQRSISTVQLLLSKPEHLDEISRR
ncbi:cyclopropane-fatty-acyl-phospholipid synthase family protein [Bowmanella sp. Y26]|uniref:SAM-dependent methyltransferase n=1 Tax=Bowmanella yangjiangensis TaxID=2811230 RepID=UPI001BDCF62E|nr:cyclopropane-fatty-acyl-phospholipid synthase family protein [Bowmanella yangjiangensis]MBT1064990.1 cyclopropane-fatty-acyl-phospholipid synthase family protein [Bowmanella yangjiangensis]